MSSFKGTIVDNGKQTFSQLFTPVVHEGEITMVVLNELRNVVVENERIF